MSESSNPMDQLGMMLTQHRWAEVFLEEVNGQGGRTLWVDGHVFVTKASHTVIVEFGCGEHNYAAWKGMGSVRLNSV